MAIVNYHPRAGYRRLTKTKTAAYTAIDGDVIEADGASGGFTITLPSAPLNVDGEISVKQIDSTSNTITVDTLNSETIDGETSIGTKQKRSYTFQSNGTNWIIR